GNALCVQLRRRGQLVASLGVSPDKLVPVVDNAGSEMREWFAAVAVAKPEEEGAGGQCGQVLLSIRYVSLAVGMIKVSVLEAVTAAASVGEMVTAQTRMVPSETVGDSGKRTRSTLSAPLTAQGVTWGGDHPHTLRYSNSRSTEPAVLHVAVVTPDAMVGYCKVPAELLVQEAAAAISTAISLKQRQRRGSLHKLGPIGCTASDFGDYIEAWYPLHACDGAADVGRVRVALAFAPHPTTLEPQWQDQEAVNRARGVADMK
ncbi:unnamed protein product, partial [Chrysoparadoxa australica]